MRGSNDADCFYKTPLGEWRVRSRAYLSWLHQQLETGAIKPLIVEGAPPARGQMELHHFSKRGRANDLLVVPIHHSTHRWLEVDGKRNVAFQREKMPFKLAWRHFGLYAARDLPSAEFIRLANLEQPEPADFLDCFNLLLDRAVASNNFDQQGFRWIPKNESVTL